MENVCKGFIDMRENKWFSVGLRNYNGKFSVILEKRGEYSVSELTGQDLLTIGVDNDNDEVLRDDIESRPSGLGTPEAILEIIRKAAEEKWDELNLSDSGLTELPPEIGDLIHLKKLYLNSGEKKNIIKHLPKEVGKLRNLEILQAYGVSLEDLPEEFAQLKKLKGLGLNDNSFSEFPDVIFSLTNLESLAINRNFKYLPSGITNLTKLKYLYMPQANIDKLPEKIGELKNLKGLCIWGSNIRILPNSMKDLVNLDWIMISKMFFSTFVPPELFGQSPLEVIGYVLKYQSDHTKINLYESKMIIVGQGGVGKTCLLNRLVHNKYDEKKSTEGIDIEPWSFVKNDTQYKLNVWDFGGQEIYHATHQFFLTHRSLYVFVWDARQEEEYGRIDYWLNTIETFANDSPIIIVINKSDSRNTIKHLDLKSLNDRFSQIIDSFKVSCKDNSNISVLREAIIEETTKLPLMGLVWLSSWLNVRKELEVLADNQNIISFSEYLEICSKYDILQAEAKSLSKYLHDLGIILNFQKDLYLKSIIILNPEWGTDAVYKVLDAQETILKDRNGILFIDDLPKIWTNKSVYPPETYPIILRLMENFQLSFEISPNDSYLIAELLDNETMVLNFKGDGPVLNFQYTYAFLPAGILTRFIVKTHAYLIEHNGKKACWKKGAYLQYRNAIGLVRLFDGITERRIEINITGNNDRDRKELLRIIRTFFEDIHRTIPKLKYKEYVKCICSQNCEYLHEYDYLLKLELENINEERCKLSLKMVEVTRLLDGVESAKNRIRKGHPVLSNNIINFNPHIEVSNKNINDIKNSNENTIEISIEIRNCINEFQGCLNELRDEVLAEEPELEKEFNKLQASTKRLDQIETKEELVKSGVLTKSRRFIEELQDPSSDIGEVIGKIKYGYSVVSDIVEKYNSIAEWCGLPIVPKVFLKSKK